MLAVIGTVPEQAFPIVSGDATLKGDEIIIGDHRFPKRMNFNTVTLHYFQPDIKWHDRFFSAIEELRQRPILIADAGSMYVAKMSGHYIHEALAAIMSDKKEKVIGR